MKIKEYKGYLTENNQLVKAGLSDNVVTKISFEGSFQANEQLIMKSIADYLEENYKMYQYKKDNGVKFGEHDLFFWTNRDDLLYFDVNINAETLEKHNQIVNSIVNYIENNYSNTQINVTLNYTVRNDWNRINDYLKQDFGVNNLPIEVLQELHRGINYAGWDFTKESVQKLNELSNLYLDQFVDKRVFWNGMKGTIKNFDENRYGFFKLRARKNYYTISLGNSDSLEIA